MPPYRPKGLMTTLQVSEPRRHICFFCLQAIWVYMGLRCFSGTPFCRFKDQRTPTILGGYPSQRQPSHPGFLHVSGTRLGTQAGDAGPGPKPGLPAAASAGAGHEPRPCAAGGGESEGARGDFWLPGPGGCFHCLT